LQGEDEGEIAAEKTAVQRKILGFVRSWRKKFVFGQQNVALKGGKGQKEGRVEQESPGRGAGPGWQLGRTGSNVSKGKNADGRRGGRCHL